MKSRPALALFAISLCLAGCHGPTFPTPAKEEAKAEQRAEAATQREQMALVPPPSKSRFMGIHSLDNWENPYLIVQPNMMQLHVLMADANPISFGAGGMFRPVGARRQVLTINQQELGDAVTAIPADDWPYGRVIALEAAHNTPASMQPAARRAIEAAVRKLSDLGILVYDPTEGNLR